MRNNKQKRAIMKQFTKRNVNFSSFIAVVNLILVILHQFDERTIIYEHIN